MGGEEYDRYVYYLDCTDGIVGIYLYISKLIKLHTVNTGSFSVCQLYINYFKITKNVVQKKSRETGISWEFRLVFGFEKKS